MKKILFYSCLIILCFSCEKYIDMEIPDKGRKIVANCFLSDTGNVTITLHKSRFILDNSNFDIITGADILLYEDGILVNTLTEDSPGIYISNGYIPISGKNYSIKVSKGTDEVTASTILPSPVPFVFVDTSRIQSEYYEYLRIKIRITDPPGVENYYMIGFEMPPKDSELEYSYVYPLNFVTDEPFIESYTDGYGLFSDVLFRGQSQVMSFDFDTYNFFNDTNTVYIKLRSISKDMYMYLLTLEAQRNASFSPFAEPVMVYNNILEGYGIFAGYTTYTDSIHIPFINSGNVWIEGKKRN